MTIASRFTLCRTLIGNLNPKLVPLYNIPQIINGDRASNVQFLSMLFNCHHKLQNQKIVYDTTFKNYKMSKLNIVTEKFQRVCIYYYI